jgi:hypothetical protein
MLILLSQMVEKCHPTREHGYSVVCVTATKMSRQSNCCLKMPDVLF